MFDRQIKARVQALLVDFRIVYIAGTRQAGKSTLAKLIGNESNMRYYTLDDPALNAAAQHDPVGLIASLARHSIIDEIQQVPALIPAIKMQSDNAAPEDKGLFLLTGSADIFRSAKVQESLPGHMVRLELYPLSQSELRGSTRNIVDSLFAETLDITNTNMVLRHDMAEILIKGSYPEAVVKSERSRREWYRSYVTARILKDFESIYTAKGDYHSKLDALIRLLSGLSGNIIKYANISNDLKQDDKSVKRYMEALELMFIIKQLKPYIRNQSKRSVLGLSKLHFIDTGLCLNLLGIHKPDVLLKSSYYGALLETFVYLEILKHSGWADEYIRIYHFRDKQKHEVDIVLENDMGEIIGIEVKASASVKAADFKGLSVLAEYSGENFYKGIIFYTGKDVLPFHYNNRLFFAVPIAAFW